MNERKLLSVPVLIPMCTDRWSSFVFVKLRPFFVDCLRFFDAKSPLRESFLIESQGSLAILKRTQLIFGFFFAWIS